MLVKTLKWILALIVLLAAVLLVGGLLLSPKFDVTRSEQIDAPPDRVYGLYRRFPRGSKTQALLREVHRIVAEYAATPVTTTFEGVRVRVVIVREP